MTSHRDDPRDALHPGFWAVGAGLSETVIPTSHTCIDFKNIIHILQYDCFFRIQLAPADRMLLAEQGDCVTPDTLTCIPKENRDGDKKIEMLMLDG